MSEGRGVCGCFFICEVLAGSLIRIIGAHNSASHSSLGVGGGEVGGGGRGVGGWLWPDILTERKIELSLD